MKDPKPLDDFESAWMKDIKKGDIVSDETTQQRLMDKMTVDPALKKSHPLSLRIPDADLEAIQIRAAKEGIPYQTLIKSILHKFATNQIDL
jgi:predicted DNA binding CopG/RHH family protein